MKNGLTSKNPICFNCKHFNPMGIGCEAFEDIPEEILSGENPHKEPLKDQGNKIIFEPISSNAKS